MTTGKFRNLASNTLLILVSLAVSLVIIELSLRNFYPRYQYAAESSFDRDSVRIWARKANSHYQRKHPDSGLTHSVYHNNMALHQHRDFSEQDLESDINLAFFGDSFTENLRLPAQYSLTEPLDFLLNRQAPRFNVLNLGVDGYGTDQSYLYYSSLDYSGNLDYVFYLFCLNDLRNIYENSIFALNDSQELMHNNISSTPWYISILSGLHTTYLALDLTMKLQSKDMSLDSDVIKQRYKRKDRKKRFHDERADAIEPAFLSGKNTADLVMVSKIFQLLLHLWSEEVKSHGGKFYVVLLPTENAHKARRLIDEDINVIDLYELFNNAMQNYDYNDWRFKKDGHWNEAGNLLAASHLYRIMEQELGMPAISDDSMKELIYRYYSSFGGWMPDARFIKESILTDDEKQAIRSTYLELEIADTGSHATGTRSLR